MLLGVAWLTGKPGKRRTQEAMDTPSQRTAGFRMIVGNCRVRMLNPLSQRVINS